MLKFVLAYRVVIDKITADKGLKLRKYELDNDNWVIVEDLISVLEVRRSHAIYIYTTNTFEYIEVQKSNTFLFTRFGRHCSSNTGYGQA